MMSTQGRYLALLLELLVGAMRTINLTPHPIRIYGLELLVGAMRTWRTVSVPSANSRWNSS